MAIGRPAPPTRSSPPRLAVVCLPDWPVVAAGALPHEPAAVFHQNRVVARTPAAASEGVRPGHRRREAQKICPALRIIDHDPARDGRQFEAAIRSVGEMVPRLEASEPGQLTFMARGPARYFGGEWAMSRRVIDLVTRAIAECSGSAGIEGVRIGLGIADGRFTAGVAANRAA